MRLGSRQAANGLRTIYYLVFLKRLGNYRASSEPSLLTDMWNSVAQLSDAQLVSGMQCVVNNLQLTEATFSVLYGVQLPLTTNPFGKHKKRPDNLK